MLAHESIESGKLWRLIIWTLRATVAMQCLGNWRWYAQIGETPLLSWLISPADVGGLGFSEAAGLAVQQTIGWLTLAAGASVIVRPCAAVLSLLVLLQLSIAVAMWQTDVGFSLQAPWLPPWLGSLFPFGTQSARIVAPLSLLLLDPWRAQRPLGKRRAETAIGIMRWGIALTFLAHGVEAWQHHPLFVDLLIGTCRRILEVELPQATAERLLSIIGIVDLLAAVACVATHWRPLLLWMAFWGGVTAISRITAFGFDSSWYASAIRAPHVGLPLAIVLYELLLRWNPAVELESPEPLAVENLQSSHRE